MLYLRTLGQLSLHKSSPEGKALLSNSNGLAVCAILATMPGRSARRSYMAELLWPGVPHSRARDSLRQAIHYVYRKTGERLVDADDATLKLDTRAITVDLVELERAAESGDYKKVIDLYGGPFLAHGVPKASPELDHWIEAENARLRVTLDVAFGRFIAECLDRGESELGKQYAQRYGALNPLAEDAQSTLIQTLASVGDVVGAFQVYQGYRELLKTELDAEPSAELQALVTGLNAGSRPMVNLTSTPVAPVQPWYKRRLAVLLIGAGLVGTLSGALATNLGILDWPGGGTGAAGDRDSEMREVYASLGRADGKHELARLRVDGGEVRLEALGLDAEEYRSPDGSLIAGHSWGPNGYDVYVREAGSDVRRIVAADSADERPRHWSPDGRYLLYEYGKALDGGRDYAFFPAIVDLQTLERRPLADIGHRKGVGATWSPDGSRIAFAGMVEEDNDIFVLAFDGTGLHNVSRRAGDDDYPAWSPDGHLLAFLSAHEGDVDVLVVRPDGSGLRLVTSVWGATARLAWLSGRTLLLSARGADGCELWAINVYSSDTHQLVCPPGLLALYPARTIVSSGSWIRRVTVAGVPAAVSPGQLMRPKLELDPRMSLEGLPIDWTVSDTSVVRFEESGLLHVLSTGSTSVIASVGGWRSDTVQISSRPLLARQVAPTFEESWTDGIQPARWILYGQPLPYSRPTGGPEGGGVFLNNGDKNYTSGVVSRQAYGFDDGLTVEAWGLMPFTGNNWEDYGLALVAEPPADSADWRKPEFVETIGFNGAGEVLIVGVPSGEHRVELPLPANVDSWQLYALQVNADRTVSAIVNGRLYWHSDWQVDFAGPVHIVLMGAAHTAEVQHGPLRVYDSAKYGIEAVQGSEVPP